MEFPSGMSIREAIISSILSTSESGICIGSSCTDGLGEGSVSISIRGSAVDESPSGGGGKRRRRPRMLGEERESLAAFRGSLYGPRELVMDAGPRAISLSPGGTRSSLFPPIGTNGNFFACSLVLVLEIALGADSAGKCVT